MKTLNLTCFFIAILISACGTTKSLKADGKLITGYRSTVGELSGEVGVPNEVTWKQNHKEFTSLIERFRDQNQKAKEKNAKASVVFKIAGAVIGLGGGIFGIASNNNATGSAITSLISGATAGLVASLGIDKKTEKTSGCYSLLNGIVLQLQGKQEAPASPAEYTEYLKKREQMIDQIKAADCYGL